jgi:hypothetical protein
MSHRLREIDRHLLQCQTELARLAPLQTWDQGRLSAVNHASTELRRALVNDGVPAESIIEDTAEKRTVFPNRTNTRFVYLYSMDDRYYPGKCAFYSGNPNARSGWVDVGAYRIMDMDQANAFVRDAFDWLSETRLAFKQQLFESAVAEFRTYLIEAEIPIDTITENSDRIIFTNKNATRVIRLNTAQNLYNPCQYKLYDGDPKIPNTWTSNKIPQIIRDEDGVKHFVYEAYVWLIDPTHK